MRIRLFFAASIHVPTPPVTFLTYPPSYAVSALVDFQSLRAHEM